MNIEERNVLTIATIARIVENTLWYCLPQKDDHSFSSEERSTRYRALKDLTSEESPFYLNAKNNGEKGDRLIENMKYFIEDCYSDDGRIITTDLHGVVHVEQSLIVELYSTIVDLRAYLDSFLISGLKYLEDQKLLEDDFKKLINDDLRYYHAFAGKIGCTLLVKKFNELNDTARIYIQSYSQSHNGVDPTKDPEFNVKNDPSFRMIENEFHNLNDSLVTCLNTYGEDDAEFKIARENVYEDSEIFTGKKRTTDTKKFFELYTNYFNDIINKTQDVLNKEFVEMGKKVSTFEANFKEPKVETENKENNDESK